MKTISAHITWLALPVAISLAACIAAEAQKKVGITGSEDSMSTGTAILRGRHSITGAVTWKDGSQVRARIRVKLTTFQGGDFSTTTDEQGRFSFGQIVNGMYTVSVDEDRDHGPASASVDVAVSERSPPQSFFVALSIGPRSEGSAKASVVKAEDAGVPRATVALYEKAVKLARSGDHKGAIALLEKAVAQYPGYLTAQNELGIDYMVVGDLSKADAAFGAALKINPESHVALMNEGVVLLRLNRTQEAEELFEHATRADASSGVAFLYLGRLRYALNKYDTAEAALRSAIALGGDDVNEAHRTLAKVYVDTEKYGKAADELAIYLKLVPTAHDAEQLRKTMAQLREAAKDQEQTPKPE